MCLVLRVVMFCPSPSTRWKHHFGTLHSCPAPPLSVQLRMPSDRGQSWPDHSAYQPTARLAGLMDVVMLGPTSTAVLRASRLHWRRDRRLPFVCLCLSSTSTHTYLRTHRASCRLTHQPLPLQEKAGRYTCRAGQKGWASTQLAKYGSRKCQS